MKKPKAKVKPVRVQLKRTKGWRMPPNTVKVDRTTKWGNPFVVGKPGVRIHRRCKATVTHGNFTGALPEITKPLLRRPRSSCAEKTSLAGAHFRQSDMNLIAATPPCCLSWPTHKCPASREASGDKNSQRQGLTYVSPYATLRT